MQLHARNKVLDLNFPKIMGILNITPDSFSDAGKFLKFDTALFQVEKMLQEGASIIDIGGESTRPGALAVTEQEELQRVIPIIEAISQRFDCWISVDTSKAIVMREAAKVGMDLINDVRALREKDALETAVSLNLPVCLMHMQGEPRTMQTAPYYKNVVEEVLTFLLDRTKIAQQAGVKPEHILWDLGFGFGKSLSHNYQLLKNTHFFAQLPYPLLIGISRKSMIGQQLNKSVEDRLVGSVTAALLAAQQGAKILRVHDVAATQDALQIWQAMLNA
ncbi:dihydropteroate synthase [Actinobacillus delphinicola]|uniref:Dihydropteroate synthase n=1 Tax=Actinobacillus delphinicola TaxID=51161 RepID=A0A448TW54_9PAST|nr:dihydropteroate synthase [Actinobacillus delphinicola]VEJ10178.1 dihydropteroate synthase [Actinobacillus delphinicola]